MRRMLREGLDRKHRVFPVEFEGGYRTVLPHLNTLVELQRTLDLQTRALLQADQKARAFIPTPEPLVRDLLSTTAMARVASVACALERFRLARGEYPSDLQSLVPQWIRVLPVDPLDRKAFRYELNDGKTYRLQGSRPEWVWGQAWTYARDR